MLPHFGVHGRGDDDPLPGLEVPGPGHRRQQVVARPVGQLGQGVGVEGRDHENVAPIEENSFEAKNVQHYFGLECAF